MFLFLCSVIVLSSCNEKSTISNNAIRQIIIKKYEKVRVTLKNGDPNYVLNMHSKDAILFLRNGTEAVGISSLKPFYEKVASTGIDIKVLVAIPDVASHAPDTAFDVEHFVYDKTNDSLTCPANEILTTNGNWYSKINGKSITKMKHYKTNACMSCHLMQQCTKNKRGRLIERSQHADVIYQNKIRIEQNKVLYRKRQAIVEHPYGIIKRQWDFYYIMTKKSIKHASADVGLIFIAFNLRRIFNLIDPKLMKKYLEMPGFVFDMFINHFKAVVSQFIFSIKRVEFCKLHLNRG